MQKIFSAVLIAFFTLQSIVPVPLPVSKTAKTCCGRSICLCTHEKGAKCPFKHGEEKAVQETRPSCHLKSKEKAKDVSRHMKIDAKTAETSSRFRAAPCHSSNPESTAPALMKDLFLKNNEATFFKLSSQPFKPSSGLFPSIIFKDPLKRPPRTFLI